MKKLLYILGFSVFVAGCSPDEDRYTLDTSFNSADIKYSQVQDAQSENVVYLQSLTPGIIPYWVYPGGSSTKLKDTLIFPFQGVYEIEYNVNTANGYVKGPKFQVEVSQTNLDHIAEPEWKYLTNTTGKRWKLDKTKPIGFYGLEYRKGAGDDWAWHPDYAGNEWVIDPDVMHYIEFDLNNAKNFKYTSVNKGVTTNCQGFFDMNLSGNQWDWRINLSNCDLVDDASYKTRIVNWRSTHIISLTENQLILGVIRVPSEGTALIGFTFVPDL
jgi:hypothetical protein